MITGVKSRRKISLARWWSAVFCVAIGAVSHTDAAQTLGGEPLWEKAQQAHDVIWRDFACPRTAQFYTSVDPQTRRPALPSPADIALNKPNPCGWGTAIENCALDGGAYLGALVDRYAVTARREHAEEARKAYHGLRLIAAAARRTGLIVRGVLPDGTTHYPESSVDQYTMYAYGLWRYYHSPVASEAEKAEIRQIFEAMLRRLEADKFVILTDDGGPSTYGALDRLAPTRAERLLAILLAGADITGRAHWRGLYLQFRPPRLEHCRGTGGRPWVLEQNQLAFFILRRLEDDRAVRDIYRAGSVEAARACAPYLEPSKMNEERGQLNALAAAFTITLTEDRSVIAEKLEAIRRVLLAYDYRDCEAVGPVRRAECIVWSLARQGVINWRLSEKGDGPNLPERPGGCCAQIRPVPFFARTPRREML